MSVFDPVVKRTINKEEQVATIVDVLCEGEIKGLADGEASIYLDNTPLINSAELEDVSGETVRGAAVQADNTINITTPISAENQTRYVGRTVRIVGAKYKSTGTVNIEENTTDFTAYADWDSVPEEVKRQWAADIYENLLSFSIGTPYLTIPGGGWNGGEWRTTLDYTFTNGATVTDPPPTTVTNGDAYFDLVTTISSFNSSTSFEVADAPGVSIADTSIIIYPDEDNTAVREKYNFENIQYQLRTGGLRQPRMSILGTQNVVASNINAEIRQSTTHGGSDAASAHQWTGTSLGFSDPSEIDKVRLSLMFPAMYRYNIQSGTEHSSRVEFQIYLQVTRNGQTFGQLIDYPIVGVRNSEINNRPTGWADGEKASYFAGDVPPESPNTGFIIENSKRRFTADFLIDLQKFKPFDDFTIRIERVTGDEREEYGYQNINQSFVQGIYGIINDKMTYPWTALAGLKFKSGDLSEVPERAYELEGLLVQVPTNYNPETREYNRNVTTGVIESGYQAWDGNFQGDVSQFTSPSSPNRRKRYTNNPAWVYYDILTNNRYGLGEFLSAQDIDKYQLYQIARYCDELVPDGKGGQEPRFTCNLYIKDRQEAYKVLSDLASIFRGMLVWINGQAVVIQDRPKSPIYTFSKANVIGGTFTYQTSAERLRTNQVNVTWNNPDRFYRQEVEICQDVDGIIESNRVISRDLVALGCTSQGQARRFGQWHLLTEKIENSIVTFSTGVNAQFLSPGDIVYIQDYDNTGFIGSGRFSSATTTTAVLDREIDLDPAETYYIHIFLPGEGCQLQEDGPVTVNGSTLRRGDLITTAKISGSFQTIDTKEKAANVTDDSGNPLKTLWTQNGRVETTEITTNGTTASISYNAISEAPPTHGLWTISVVANNTNEALTSRKFRIINITEDSENGVYEITANEYADEKFLAIDRGETVYERPFEALPNYSDVVPPPRSLSFSFRPVPISGSGAVTRDQQFGAGTDGYIYWEAPFNIGSEDTYDFINSYQVRHNFNSSKNFGNIIEASPNQRFVKINNVSPGKYKIKVRSRNMIGRYSKWESLDVEFTEDQMSDGVFLVSKVNKIKTGGSVDTTVGLNSSTGILSFAASDYIVNGPNGEQFNAAGLPLTYDFSGLDNGEVGYLIWDSTNNEWKVMELFVDTQVQNNAGVATNFKYWTTLNAANRGLVKLTGTVSAATTELINGTSYTTFSDKFTVSGNSNLSSEIGVGNLILANANATDYGYSADSWYGYVSNISGNTQITTEQIINKAFNNVEFYTTATKLNHFRDFIGFAVSKSGGVYTLLSYTNTNPEPVINIIVDNLNHLVPTDSAGANENFTNSGFSVRVLENGVEVPYDIGQSTSRYSVTATPTNVTLGAASLNGNVRVYADATAMAADTATVAITVNVINKINQWQSYSYTQILAKAKEGAQGPTGATGPTGSTGATGPRGSGSFVAEESTSIYIDATSVSVFVSSPNDLTTQQVANLVIAESSDGYLRTGDRITLTDTSQGTAGTRIWQGASVNSSVGLTAAGNWSSLVVEVIPGSAIVEGTLSAEALTANTTMTTNLLLGSGGAIRQNKTWWGDSTAGLFLGDNGGTPMVNIGNSSNYLQWNGSALTVAGTFTVGGMSVVGDIITYGSGNIKTLNKDAYNDLTNGFFLGGNGTVGIGGANGSLRFDGTNLYLSGNIVGGQAIQSANFSATTGFQLNSNGVGYFRGIEIKNAAGNTIMAAGSGVTEYLPVTSQNKVTAANASTFISNLAVDTLQIADTAITVPVSSGFAQLTGNGFEQLMGSVSITVDVTTPILVFITFEQGYSGTLNADWGFRVYHVNSATNLVNRYPMTAIVDMPAWSGVQTVSAGTHTFRLYWTGESSNVLASARMTLLGVKK